MQENTSFSIRELGVIYDEFKKVQFFQDSTAQDSSRKKDGSTLMNAIYMGATPGGLISGTMFSKMMMEICPWRPWYLRRSFGLDLAPFTIIMAGTPVRVRPIRISIPTLIRAHGGVVSTLTDGRDWSGLHERMYRYGEKQINAILSSAEVIGPQKSGATPEPFGMGAEEDVEPGNDIPSEDIAEIKAGEEERIVSVNPSPDVRENVVVVGERRSSISSSKPNGRVQTSFTGIDLPSIITILDTLCNKPSNARIHYFFNVHDSDRDGWWTLDDICSAIDSLLMLLGGASVGGNSPLDGTDPDWADIAFEVSTKSAIITYEGRYRAGYTEPSFQFHCS
jgi:hypothetical protein